MQLQTTTVQYIDDVSVMALELGISVYEIESYYRNYYINRTLPIRDLTANEIGLVKYYEEVKYYAKVDIMNLCQLYNLTFDDYMKDMWIIPKEIVKMSDDEYAIAKKYAPLILSPYLNYKNYKAPRLTPLSQEEIAMLLSNIAVGISILPEEQITARTSMEAMDRILKIYENLPKKEVKGVEKFRDMTPEQLEKLIEGVSNTMIPVEKPKKETKNVRVKSENKTKKQTDK